MKRVGSSRPEGLRVAVRSPDRSTIEQWYQHRSDARRVIVRTFRRDNAGFFREDESARRLEDIDAWEAIRRSASTQFREREHQHPLAEIEYAYGETAFNKRSLRDRMLHEILDEIVDADLAGDDDWLIDRWRDCALRFERRCGWVRSAGESPLRTGPTRGAAQRQLLGVARAVLKPIASARSRADVAAAARRAAGTLATRVTEHFPVLADQTDANLETRATAKLIVEIENEWARSEPSGFPDDDTVRRIVRRAIAACELPERVGYTFFHAEHEAASRKRRRKKAG